MAAYSYKKNKQLSKHFNNREFASIVNGQLYTDRILVNKKLVTMLEKFFDYGIGTVIVLSGYRNTAADRAVGGDGYGAHTKGLAADIVAYKNGKPLSSKVVAALASLIGFSGIGITGPTGCHVDVRDGKNYKNAHWWGDETTGNNYIKSFLNYAGLTRATLYGTLGYYKKKLYSATAIRQTPIYYLPNKGTAIKSRLKKGKKQKVYAEKNGFLKISAGWVLKSDLKK